MTPAPELRKTWQQLGISEEDLEMKPDGTIRAEPSAKTRPSDDLLRTLDEIPEDAADITPLPRLSSDEVEASDILGEGGMGRIWLAEQRSLRREVAVKGLRPAVEGPIARMQLLREARVTGRLEHPNVVPVHVLVRDDQGSPRMVMKRVEGRSWIELIDETRGTDEHLETHLRILSQVCHAVHYAHSKGVLHRDLKPDNVMVGEYGEVYVVDWGIAVAIADGPGLDELPHAKDVRGIVGTLPYMAPEMVAGEGSGLGPRTDVYLLGSILHEILTGRQRHEGDALPQLVHAAWLSEPPDYSGDDVPYELAQLVKRTTAPNPADRPPTAEAFRRELESFLTHRSANLLAAEGEERFAEAERLITEGQDPLPALHEARFAYGQALRIWSESPVAREGLRRVLSFWMRRALAERDLGNARTLLKDMEPDQQDRWRDQVHELGAELYTRDRKLAELEAAAEDADVGVAAKQRRGFGIAFGLLFAALNVALDVVERRTGLFHLGYVFWTGVLGLAFTVPALAMRRSLFPNRGSQRLAWALAMLICGQVVIFGALMVLNVPLRPTLALSLFPFGSAILTASLLVAPRIGWTGGVAWALGTLALFVPEAAFYAVAASYAVFFIAGSVTDYGARIQANIEAE